jgi:hypothetical protein
MPPCHGADTKALPDTVHCGGQARAVADEAVGYARPRKQVEPLYRELDAVRDEDYVADSHLALT